mmetsp:Transcript_1711/g.6598  ORF Transcript_1711/g.6598 Transcript_1711/m.6598 type:complete len:280 (-) Transcript_1711:1346-2185(-)
MTDRALCREAAQKDEGRNEEEEEAPPPRAPPRFRPRCHHRWAPGLLVRRAGVHAAASTTVASAGGSASAASAAAASRRCLRKCSTSFSSTLALMSSERMYLMRCVHLRRSGLSVMYSPGIWRQLCIFMRTLPTCQMRCLSRWRSSDEICDEAGRRRSLATSKTAASIGAPGGTRSFNAWASLALGSASRRACDSFKMVSQRSQRLTRSGALVSHEISWSGVAPGLGGVRSTKCKITERNSIWTASESASSAARLKLKRSLTKSAMRCGSAYARTTDSAR